MIANETDVLLRQVVASVPPDGDIKQPDVNRSYEVAWVGSSHACARGTTSDFSRGFWIVIVGPWLGLGPVLAGLAIRRRLGPTDESRGDPRSLSA